VSEVGVSSPLWLERQWTVIGIVSTRGFTSISA
jgi:hypothetical protein